MNRQQRKQKQQKRLLHEFRQTVRRLVKEFCDQQKLQLDDFAVDYEHQQVRVRDDKGRVHVLQMK